MAKGRAGRRGGARGMLVGLGAGWLVAHAAAEPIDGRDAERGGLDSSAPLGAASSANIASSARTGDVSAEAGDESARRAASAPDEPEPLVLTREALELRGAGIVGGQRVERVSPERWSIGRATFPSGGRPEGMALPERLGGGFLFHQSQVIQGRAWTALYRGESWSGPLEALGALSFVVEGVRAGFDRLYLMGHGEWLAFDPEARRVKSMAPLPALPALDGLAFSSGGTAAVHAPLLGAWSTDDAGLSWRPLPDVLGVEEDEGVVLVTAQGRERLGPDGRRTPYRAPREAADPGERSPVEVIERALLRGVRHGRTIRAWLDGEWLELRYDEGLELVRRGPAPAPGDCQGFEHAERPWFLCRAADTRVFGLEGDDATLLAQLPGRRRLLAAGAGGVLLAGRCGLAGEPSGPGERACWVRRASEAGPGPARAELVAIGGWERALGVGVLEAGVRMLERRRQGLALIDPTGARAPRSYALPEEGELRRLLLEGTLLPQLHESAEGIGVWATRGEEFVGVTFGRGEQPSAGPIQRSARRTLFAGRRALSWGAAGFAKETLDGGSTWRELAFPFRSGDPDPNVASGSGEVRMGCGAAGCVVGRALRVGWGRGEETEAAVLPTPEPIPIPPRGAGRFRFDCAGGGTTRGLTAPATFFDRVSEAKAQAGGTLVRVEVLDGGGALFASGPSDVGWGREGRAQLLFRDPFSSSIRATRVTRGLFSDTARAQEALGQLDSGTSMASITLDAAGEGGFVSVSRRAGIELFTFDVDGPLERVEGAAELGLRRLHGAARVGGIWYTGQRSQEGFTVLRVEAGRLVEHARFVGSAGNLGTVEVVTGPGLGLGLALEGDEGTFVHGLGAHGELGEPSLLPPRGARPRTCVGDEPGYRVVRELASSPLVESGGAVLDVGRVWARYRFGPGWSCIEGLAARTRGLSSGELGALPRRAPGSGDGLPLELIVTDLGGDGRIDRLVCR